MTKNVILVAGLFAGVSSAQIIGAQRFESSVNLVGGFTAANNLDGGPGDAWAIGGVRGNWFQAAGVPFSLADDSVVAVSNGGAPFANDREGVFGQNRDRNDLFFGMSDSDEFGARQTASWTFATGRARNLGLSVDLGGISESAFGGYTLGQTFIDIAYSIDGGAFVTAMRVEAVAAGGFVTRLMDSGNQSGGGNLLRVVTAGVTKINADTGAAVNNLFLDKATVATGEMDTFTTALNGIVSNQITVRVTANMPFEAAAFDNIVLTPAPGAAALVGFGGLFAARRRR